MEESTIYHVNFAPEEEAAPEAPVKKRRRPRGAHAAKRVSPVAIFIIGFVFGTAAGWAIFQVVGAA